MKGPRINVWYVIIVLIALFALLKQCESEPRIITETETKIVQKTDTIIKVEIKEVPKTVFVEKVLTQKGKDSIVYVDQPTETSIQANQFETKLESNQATADLKITTTGTLLDVQGVINYPEKETITTITKLKDKSGFYIYGSMPVTSDISPEVGVMFQIRNRVIIGAGAQYNNFTNNIDAKVTLAVKL